jgi:formylglycine-generating enzyme required for sulfatase activity
MGRLFPRPSSLLGSVRELASNTEVRFLIAYYIGHAWRGDRGFLAFAQPTSSPGRWKTHVPLSAILDITEKSTTTQTVMIVDTPEALSNAGVPDLRNTALILFRHPDAQLRSSATVRSRQQRLTACVGEIMLEACAYLPSFTFEALLTTVAFLLDSTPSEFFEIAGAEDLLRTRLLTESRGGKLWGVFEHNLASLNRGSREDGIDELAPHLRTPRYRNEAKFLLSYFAAVDPSSEVRSAARSVLSDKKAPQQPQRCVSTPSGRVLPKPQWLLVSGGEFTMGSDHEHDSFALPEEMPSNRLFLRDFFISKYQVSRSDWLEYCRATGVSFPAEFGDPDLHSNLWKPITGVNWYDAWSYCEWLSELLKARRMLSFTEVLRLPSEAEWEKAARGSSGRIFPWGNRFEAHRCNSRSSGLNEVVEIGRFAPQGDSPCGAVDMSGNVWEWTMSLWGESGHTPEFGYPYDPFDGRENCDAPETIRRIIRGGAFYYFDECVRTATRNIMLPTMHHSGGGFRIVRSDSSQSPVGARLPRLM